MENNAIKICPYCNTPINEGEAEVVCPACSKPHHERCWVEHNGCTTYGCPQNTAAQAPVPPVVNEAPAVNEAPVNGAYQQPPVNGAYQQPPVNGAYQQPPVNGAYQQAPVNGAYQQPPMNGAYQQPPVNGAYQQPGMYQAPVNGYQPPVQPPVEAPAPKKKSKKKIVIIAAAAIVVIVLIAAIGGSSGPNFKNLYSEYCVSTWADVGSDGSYLSIDTNPFDEDDNGVAYPSAVTAVKNINKALGLPDSLYNDMAETTWSMGKQSQTFDNVTVTWTYHPDKGLEVTYKK